MRHPEGVPGFWMLRRLPLAREVALRYAGNLVVPFEAMIAWGLLDPARAWTIKLHRPSLCWIDKPFSLREATFGVSGSKELQRLEE